MKAGKFIAKGLAKVGLANKAISTFGIEEIKPNDTFVVSYPKSGNTWVRFLIANCMNPVHPITMRNINDYVPGAYNFARNVNQLKDTRFIKVHHTFFEAYPKTVYIYRDYRDVLISYYHFQVSKGEFNGEMRDFIVNGNHDRPYGSWVAHVGAALKFQAKNPERMLLVRYESLFADTIEELRRIVEFTGLSPDLSLEEIVAACAFDNLQALEKEHGNVLQDQGRMFFRAGRAGQWRSELSRDDYELVFQMPGVENMLRELNYPV